MTLDNRIIRQINPYDAINYLKIRGWSEEHTDDPRVLKFLSPRPIRLDGPRIDILIPKSRELVGSTELLETSLRIISSFEKRDVSYIISEILNFSDCFETRILGAKKGLLPLDLGVLLYRGSFDLLKTGAAYEYNISHNKGTRIPQLAMEYAKSSLIGPGRYGSYIAHIYIPLKRPSSDFPWDGTSPFQRKVVLRILRGLADLKKAEIEESADPIINNNTSGLNVGMCKAIKNINNAGMGNNVIVNAVLEPTYKAPPDISTRFILKPRTNRYLDEAIAIFEEDAHTVISEEEIVGVPIILSREENIDRGTIRLKWYHHGIKKTITVYLDLDKNNYQQAIMAHSGKKNILVVGELEYNRKRWYLNNPRDFRVISDEARPEKALDKFRW